MAFKFVYPCTQRTRTSKVLLALLLNPSIPHTIQISSNTMPSFIRDGIYRIKSAHPRNSPDYLEKKSNGIIATTAVVDNSGDQNWAVTAASDGTYQIYSIERFFSQRSVLKVTGSGKKSKPAWSTGTADTWTIEPRGDTYVIGNSKGESALHLTESKGLRVWPRDNSMNQRWYFEAIEIYPEQGKAKNTGTGTGTNVTIRPGLTTVKFSPLLLLECCTPHKPTGSKQQPLLTANIPAPSGNTLDHLTVYLTINGNEPYYTIVDVYLAADSLKDDVISHYLDPNKASWAADSLHMAIPILDTGKVFLLGRVFQGRAMDPVAVEQHFELNVAIPAKCRIYMSVRSGPVNYESQYIGVRATLRSKLAA